MALLSRGDAGLVGVDISATSVKLVDLSKSGDKYRVEGYAIVPLPPNAIGDKNIADSGLVGEAIQQAVKICKTKRKAACCAVPGSSAITKVISMPEGLSDEDMEAQIKTEADQYIPYPLDEISLDFEVMRAEEADTTKVEVLLAATRSENVDVRVAALEAGGLTAKVVDIEPFAMEKAVSLMMSQGGEVGNAHILAIMDIGASTSIFTVMEDAHIIYTKEQPFGGRALTEDIQRRYGLSFEEATREKHNGGVMLPDNYEPEVLAPFKEQMAQEVNRALQFFYAGNQGGGVVDHILIAGGCASLNGICELVQAKTGTTVSVANPFFKMGIPDNIRESLMNDAPALMIACGLALRSFD